MFDKEKWDIGFVERSFKLKMETINIEVTKT